MTQKDLAMLKPRPFIPFTLRLADQESIKIETPEQIIVGPTAAVILRNGDLIIAALEGFCEWKCRTRARKITLGSTAPHCAAALTLVGSVSL